MNEVEQASQHLRNSLLRRPGHQWVNFWCGFACGTCFVLLCLVALVWIVSR